MAILTKELYSDKLLKGYDDCINRYRHFFNKDLLEHEEAFFLLHKMFHLLGFDVSRYVKSIVKIGFDNKYFTFSLKEKSLIAKTKANGHFEDFQYFEQNGLNFQVNDHLKAKLCEDVSVVWRQAGRKRENFYNILKKDNIALKEHKFSNIICLDIDTHFEVSPKKFRKLKRTILHFLKGKFKVNPLFVEVSKRRAGFHIYLKTDSNLDHKKAIECVLVEEIRKKLGNKISGIDVRSNNKAIRLPFAIDYLVYDNLEEKGLIDYIQILKHFTRNYADKDSVLKYSKILSDYYDIIEKHFPDLVVSEFETPTAWKKKYSTKKKINYSIGSGERVGGGKVIFSLGFACIARGYSYEDFLSECNKANKGSKDLTKWFQSGEISFEGNKELKQIWDWCNKHYKQQDNYVASNRSETYKFKETLETNKYKVFIRGFIKSFPYNKRKIYQLVLTEIFKRIEESDKNPRKVDNKIALTKKLKEQLCIGYQFSRDFKNKLKEHFNLKVDIEKLFNIILNDLNLFIQYIPDNLKLGYVPPGTIKGFTSCKQYILNVSLINFFLYSNFYYIYLSPFLTLMLNILLCVVSFRDYFFDRLFLSYYSSDS
ncbi:MULTISPECIES: hypothetical protein [Leptospira]|uniref:hypothetical protein n=1 Tax=Leptospira TaxID=171 RepID=UPI00109157F4|nr:MULTISPECIES: hypothetical protein [Leptospira]TGL99668.1 hypothetical protein EHQ79_17995 [Leptospira jelokensis]TGM80504.1 hypothetical protein EHQ99_12605 [Leptospira bouyouniensis]